jgi:hypothetical protein
MKEDPQSSQGEQDRIRTRRDFTVGGALMAGGGFINLLTEIAAGPYLYTDYKYFIAKTISYGLFAGGVAIGTEAAVKLTDFVHRHYHPPTSRRSTYGHTPTPIEDPEPPQDVFEPSREQTPRERNINYVRQWYSNSDVKAKYRMDLEQLGLPTKEFNLLTRAMYPLSPAPYQKEEPKVFPRTPLSMAGLKMLIELDNMRRPGTKSIWDGVRHFGPTTLMRVKEALKESAE